MTQFGHVLVGLLMMIGVVGVIVPILPGLLLVLGSGLWWTIGDGGTPVHWVTFGVMTALFALGTYLKYAVPARSTVRAGATTRSMIFAVLLALVGFFVIPVVGAVIGFVLGIYLSELQRLRDRSRAWTATKAALKGVLLSTLIELSAGVLMVVAWIVGVWIT